jgi:hypothetical protein
MAPIERFRAGSRTTSQRRNQMATGPCIPACSGRKTIGLSYKSAPARCTRSPKAALPRIGTTRPVGTHNQPHRRDGPQYRWLRELLEILEHASNPEEFLEHTKLEMFKDQVFAFTPRGDLINLPAGATPVDFAYAVHSEVGDRCVGSKVNGRMMPLRSELSNGDQVEILTSKAQTPSRRGSGLWYRARPGHEFDGLSACKSANNTSN